MIKQVLQTKPLVDEEKVNKLLAGAAGNEALNRKKRLQRGQGMTEYIIIVGVIAIAAIGAFGFFGDVVEQQIAGMAKELSGQDGSLQNTAAGTAAGKAVGLANTHNDLSNYSENGSGAAAGGGGGGGGGSGGGSDGGG